MNHPATAGFDAGDVRGPGYWVLSGTVHVLHEITKIVAAVVARPATDDAAAVRALAESVRMSDPGFANDLYAAAARFEGERDDEDANRHRQPGHMRRA